MLSLPSQTFPAFPPVSDAVSFLSRLPWRRYGSAVVSGFLIVAAIAYVLHARALRSLATNGCTTIAQTAPIADDRSALIAKLATCEPMSKLRKMSTARLARKAKLYGFA